LQSLHLLQHSNLRHSFQAPTLIGCQIFKEQGTANFVMLLVFPLSFLLLVIHQKQRSEIMKEFFVHVKSVFIILQNFVYIFARKDCQKRQRKTDMNQLAKQKNYTFKTSLKPSPLL
jgi:hypothetical protein